MNDTPRTDREHNRIIADEIEDYNVLDVMGDFARELELELSAAVAGLQNFRFRAEQAEQKNAQLERTLATHRAAHDKILLEFRKVDAELVAEKANVTAIDAMLGAMTRAEKEEAVENVELRAQLAALRDVLLELVRVQDETACVWRTSPIMDKIRAALAQFSRLKCTQ